MYTNAFGHKAKNPLVDATEVPSLAEGCLGGFLVSVCNTLPHGGVTCCSAEVWPGSGLSVLSDGVRLTLFPDQDA